MTATAAFLIDPLFAAPMRRVAIITGTGLYTLQGRTGDAAPQEIQVDTPYGPESVMVHETGKLTLFHVNRHGATHRVPPHKLDPRRTLDAIARCGAEAVFALQNTGSLRPTLQAGHIVVPHDLIDFTGHPHHTFFDDDVVHIDFSEPYCRATRRLLITAMRASDWPEAARHERGVFIATRGPRFETPAETAHLGRLGDVVGMTGAGEATLARERGLCYSALAFVANPAAGVAGVPRSAQDIRKALAAEGSRLNKILRDAANRIDGREECGCQEAPRLGRLAPETPPP